MYVVAIVGVTGAVGGELLKVLDKRDFPIKDLVPLASARSAGSTISFRGAAYTVKEATASAFEGVDIAFFSAGATRSRALVPAAQAAGALVVDNSSAFRADDAIPLVVPEVNPQALIDHPGVVANPNCVAAILTVAIAPLAKLGHIKRLVISTYQSASGAGARAMDDLVLQTTDVLAGKEAVPRVLLHPFAFNLFSHDSPVEDNGYNGEENKVAAEIKKIMARPQLGVSVTCVRVPILRAHTASVNIEFDQPVSVADARAAIIAADGVDLVDDSANNHYPMPNETSGQDHVKIGRIRKDPSHANALNIFVCGDQLLKGAALNAVQVAEALTRS